MSKVLVLVNIIRERYLVGFWRLVSPFADRDRGISRGGLISSGSQVERRKTKLFNAQLGIEPPPPGRQLARGQELSGEQGTCWPLAMP